MSGFEIVENYSLIYYYSAPLFPMIREWLLDQISLVSPLDDSVKIATGVRYAVREVRVVDAGDHGEERDGREVGMALDCLAELIDAVVFWVVG